MDASLFPEIQLEGADALLPVLGLARSKVAQKLEVCAEGADRHFTARIIERVVMAEIELGSIQLTCFFETFSHLYDQNEM